jgi:hypothetical protein
MSKVCFVISPMGPKGTRTRVRADYVLATYIRAACKETGYEDYRADRGVGRDIVMGTNTALQNAPMAVAYMGRAHEPTSCWNANVMVEIGYRLASRLPLIFLCDEGDLQELPLNLEHRNVIGLPSPNPEDPGWVDSKRKETVDSLIEQIRHEELQGRFLDSVHPLAAINAAQSDARNPDNLFYTGASLAANDLFFGNEQGRRLVGRRMDEFLNELKKRMHPAQWRAFERDQIRARTELSRGQHAIAKVPVVFENHENSHYNHRAFLPIIVQEFRPQEDRVNWYNLHVLYLNVTTATKKVRDNNGEEYYVCNLDQWTDTPLDPLKPYEPIRIFLSYRSDNKASVDAVNKLLVALKPYVAPFIDSSMEGGDDWLSTLETSLQESELCFLFLDDRDMGPGQEEEVKAILTRRFTPAGKKYAVVPVLLRSSAEVPLFLRAKQCVKFADLTEGKLKQMLWRLFPGRCPDYWAEDEDPAKEIKVPANDIKDVPPFKYQEPSLDDRDDRPRP